MKEPHAELNDILLKTALLGTARQALAWPANRVDAEDDGASTHPDADLAALMRALGTADPEGALLGAVAGLAVYRRAGQMPLIGDAAAPEPCAPDELPTCGPRAAARLALLLQGSNAALLLEWLAVAIETQQRAPEMLLPNLLDAGRQHADWRDAIPPVLGHRGHWLAAHNPAWSYVAGEIADRDETWLTGNKAARLNILRLLREQDPEQARTLLMQTWEEEASKDRTDFLQTFTTNLGMADEPFIETTLTDRRKEVRTVAVDLLSRLPESRFAKRMIERLRPLLRVVKGEQKGKLGGLPGSPIRIEVTLPASFEQAMERDGIQQKPPVGGKRIGEKAWWLQQMLALTPLDHWSREWSLAPAEIIQAAKGGEWSDVLLEGFSQAAQHQQHPEWLEAFLSESVSEKIFAAPQLLQGLPAARVEAFLLSLLNSAAGPPSNIEILLLHCQRPWSATFTRAILDVVHREALTKQGTQKPRYHWLYSNLKEFALYIPVDMAGELIREWSKKDTPDDYQRRSIEEFLEILHFRAEMVRELKTRR